MKKMKRILTGMLILCLMVLAAGCSEEANASNDPAKFAEANSGTWYRYGNTQDDKLIIYDDGTWEHYEDSETISAEGIIEYDKEDKKLDFVNVAERIYFPCFMYDDGALEFNFSRYFPEENSMDGFDEYFGSWYLDGDTSKEYLTINTFGESTVRWLYSVPLDETGQSVEQRSGELIWNGIKNVFIADDYPDEDFAVFTIKDTGVLSSNGKDYILVKYDDYYEDDFETEDDYDNDDLQVMGVNFYLNGDHESEVLCLYLEDNTFSITAPDWPDDILGTYSVDDSIVTLTVGENEFYYEVKDNSTKLVDEYGNEYVYIGEYDFETEADSSSQETDIIGGEFYYLNGDSESESLYFFTIDNTVDLDIPGQDTIEGAYSISGNILTVIVGETEFYYEISEDGTKLVDEYGDEYLCDIL